VLDLENIFVKTKKVHTTLSMTSRIPLCVDSVALATEPDVCVAGNRVTRFKGVDIDHEITASHVVLHRGSITGDLLRIYKKHPPSPPALKKQRSDEKWTEANTLFACEHMLKAWNQVFIKPEPPKPAAVRPCGGKGAYIQRIVNVESSVFSTFEGIDQLSSSDEELEEDDFNVCLDKNKVAWPMTPLMTGKELLEKAQRIALLRNDGESEDAWFRRRMRFFEATSSEFIMAEYQTLSSCAMTRRGNL
jgi:hypothetical protein